MAASELPTRTPKSRLERVAASSVWWLPLIAVLPAAPPLHEVPWMLRILVGGSILLAAVALLAVLEQSQMAARLARDARELGIIDCFIRYPNSRPGSLRRIWAAGTAELKPGSIIFHESYTMTPFENNRLARAPLTLQVESLPVRQELEREQRTMLRRNQAVVQIDTDRETIELAADRLSLDALLQRVYREETGAQ
jgi:hypothetical protein